MALHIIFLTALAVWRLCILLIADDGPYDIINKFRVWVRKRKLDRLIPIECMYCASVWFALPFAIYLQKSLFEFIVIWFALSAGAILINSSNERINY